MAEVTKAANAHTTIAGNGWTNPSNAYAAAADTNYATTLTGITTKNYSDTGDFGFPDFSSSDIPDGSTINAVYIDYYGEYLSGTGPGVMWGIIGRISGADAGTEVTDAANTSPASSTWTFTTVPTLANLRSASSVIKARVRGSKGSTSSTFTIYTDGIALRVDYTAPSAGGGGYPYAGGGYYPTSG